MEIRLFFRRWRSACFFGAGHPLVFFAACFFGAGAPLVFSALAAACFFGAGRLQLSSDCCLGAPLVFSALAARLYFRRWPPLVFSALAEWRSACFFGAGGPLVFSALAIRMFYPFKNWFLLFFLGFPVTYS